MEIFKKLILIPIFILQGCVVNNIQETNTLNSSHLNGNSYILGSFLYSDRNSYARLSIELINTQTKKEYLIELRRPEVFRGIEVYNFPAGEYQLSNIVRLTGIGELTSKHEIVIPTLKTPFILQENHGVYIGHYDGKTDRDVLTMFLAGAIFADNNTQATKVYTVSKNDLLRELKEQHPYLNDVEIDSPFSIDSSTQKNESSPWK